MGNKRGRPPRRLGKDPERDERPTCEITFILPRVTVLNHPDVLDLAELLERFPQVILLEALVADDEEPRVRRIVVLRAQIRLRIIRVPFSVVGHFPNTMNASATPLPRTIYRLPPEYRRPTSVYGSQSADGLTRLTRASRRDATEGWLPSPSLSVTVSSPVATRRTQKETGICLSRTNVSFPPEPPSFIEKFSDMNRSVMHVEFREGDSINGSLIAMMIMNAPKMCEGPHRRVRRRAAKNSILSLCSLQRR